MAGRVRQQIEPGPGHAAGAAHGEPGRHRAGQKQPVAVPGEHVQPGHVAGRVPGRHRGHLFYHAPGGPGHHGAGGVYGSARDGHRGAGHRRGPGTGEDGGRHGAGLPDGRHHPRRRLHHATVRGTGARPCRDRGPRRHHHRAGPAGMGHRGQSRSGRHRPQHGRPSGVRDAPPPVRGPQLAVHALQCLCPCGGSVGRHRPAGQAKSHRRARGRQRRHIGPAFHLYRRAGWR